MSIPETGYFLHSKQKRSPFILLTLIKFTHINISLKKALIIVRSLKNRLQIINYINIYSTQSE